MYSPLRQCPRQCLAAPSATACAVRRRNARAGRLEPVGVALAELGELRGRNRDAIGVPAAFAVEILLMIILGPPPDVEGFDRGHDRLGLISLVALDCGAGRGLLFGRDRKSTRLNSSH